MRVETLWRARHLTHRSSPALSSAPRPLRVLLPPPLESLECGLPNTVWGSDHISLVCDFEVVWPQGGGG